MDYNPCYINISIPNKMEPPIYMYYKLTNYYQNHRRYVKSRSDMQLRGMSGHAVVAVIICATTLTNTIAAPVATFTRRLTLFRVCPLAP